MTHPPGQPSGPTGPGRTETPGSAAAAHSPSAGPGIEVTPVLDGADRILAEPLPRFGEVIRDAERLFRQALAVIERPIDMDSYPAGVAGHLADAATEIVGFHAEAALCELGNMAALPSPPVGSAVKVARPPLGFIGPVQESDASG